MPLECIRQAAMGQCNGILAGGNWVWDNEGLNGVWVNVMGRGFLVRVGLGRCGRVGVRNLVWLWS